MRRSTRLADWCSRRSRTTPSQSASSCSTTTSPIPPVARQARHPRDGSRGRARAVVGYTDRGTARLRFDYGPADGAGTPCLSASRFVGVGRGNLVGVPATGFQCAVQRQRIRFEPVRPGPRMRFGGRATHPRRSCGCRRPCSRPLRGCPPETNVDDGPCSRGWIIRLGRWGASVPSTPPNVKLSHYQAVWVSPLSIR
jgi:hypothetical protein